MTTRRTTPSDESAAQAAAAFGAALNETVTSTMAKSASAFGRGARAFQQEGVKFWVRRIEDNMKAAEQFGACRTLPDLFAAQQKWFADTARAYNEELARCGELMTGVLESDTKAAGNGRSDRTPSDR